MTKNEIKQMVNFISKYEKRLFEMNKQNEKLFFDNSTFVEKLERQEKEIDKLKDENEQLKANVQDLEIEINSRLTCGFVKTAQKQAKIDVLNKVKSLVFYDDNYLDGCVFIDDIEKLLKELQK